VKHLKNLREIEWTSQSFSWLLWELRTSDLIQIVTQSLFHWVMTDIKSDIFVVKLTPVGENRYFLKIKKWSILTFFWAMTVTWPPPPAPLWGVLGTACGCDFRGFTFQVDLTSCHLSSDLKRGQRRGWQVNLTSTTCQVDLSSSTCAQNTTVGPWFFGFYRLTRTCIVPLSLVRTWFVPLPVCGHSQGIYFPPNTRGGV